MPFCPKCKYEYQSTIKKCPDCGVALVDKLPEEPEDRYSDEEFVPVFIAKDKTEAEVVKGVLLGAGIPVIEEPYTGDIPAPTVYGLPDEEALTVPISRLEEAKNILEDAESVGKSMSSETS